MAGGLVALLDDVAALVKATAASLDDVAAAAGRASIKATGVVVDDTAVTPRYVQGLRPDRELPIVRQIAIGSLRNKLLIILPVILLLSQVLPTALTPILMLGGAFLCFEGAEKVWEAATGHHEEELAQADPGPEGEKRLVAGAIRTDLILSAEIMVISLNEVAAESLLNRAIILVVVAIVITTLVYGVVALIVKMDDVGLALATSRRRGTARFGRGLVTAMPRVLAALSTIGIAAMLWVGGHIIVDGLHELGVHAPHDLIHHASDAVAGVGGVGGILAWLVETLCAALLGLLVGAAVVLVVHLVRGGRAHDTADREGTASA